MRPYKNRKIDFGKPVRVYRNLTKNTEGYLPWFSIMQNGKVVAHGQNLALHSTKFIVNELTRQRVIRDRKKYVHAFVEGFLWKSPMKDLQKGFSMQLPYRVTYSPFENEQFIAQNTAGKFEIFESAYVIINKYGVTATGPAFI